MKKYIVKITLISLAVVTLPISFALAVTTKTDTVKPATSTQQTKAIDQRMQSLKDRGTQEIDRRDASLNGLINKISGMKRLSAGQKSSFLADIQSNISELSGLKSTIAAETDLAKLKDSVQSIVKSYRIYALYMPKIHLLSASDAIGEITDNLTTLTEKLEVRIVKAKDAGNDVTALTAKLTDMKAKIADAKTQSQTVVNTVTPLDPAGYPGNSTTLKNAQSVLKTVRGDIEGARKDAREIVTGLKALEKPVTTPAAAAPTQN